MKSETVPMTTLVILGSVSLVFLAGCGSGTFNNPTPTITTISPNTAEAGGAAFTLTINGTNFVAASMVNFGGAARTTTFVSATRLVAAIPGAAIASTGTAAVTVTNPAPRQGTSDAVNFTISEPPIRVTVSPSSTLVVATGAQQFIVTVSPLRANQTVNWNVSGEGCTESSCGTIDANGKYTAPAIVPNPAAVMVAA